MPPIFAVLVCVPAKSTIRKSSLFTIVRGRLDRRGRLKIVRVLGPAGDRHRVAADRQTGEVVLAVGVGHIFVGLVAREHHRHVRDGIAFGVHLAADAGPAQPRARERDARLHLPDPQVHRPFATVGKLYALSSGFVIVTV